MKIKKLCLALVAAGLLIGGSAAFGGMMSVYNRDGKPTNVAVSASTSSTSEDVGPDTAGKLGACFNEEAKGFLKSIYQVADNAEPLELEEMVSKSGYTIYCYEESAIKQFTIASDKFEALPPDVKAFARKIFSCSARGEKTILTFEASLPFVQ